MIDVNYFSVSSLFTFKPSNQSTAHHQITIISTQWVPFHRFISISYNNFSILMMDIRYRVWNITFTNIFSMPYNSTILRSQYHYIFLSFLVMIVILVELFTTISYFHQTFKYSFFIKVTSYSTSFFLYFAQSFLSHQDPS